MKKIAKLQVNNETGNFTLLGEKNQIIGYATLTTKFDKSAGLVNLVVDGVSYNSIPFETIGKMKAKMSHDELDMKMDEERMNDGIVSPASVVRNKQVYQKEID